MLTFHMDESGFTGQDLISADQPVFVQASIVLGDDECRALRTEFFSGVQAPELKHSVIARRTSGRDRIVRLVEAINAHHNGRLTTWFVHKEFTLLTYLVDLWVETAMHNDGVDLYEDGGNLALSNMAFYCLRTFQSPKFLKAHLSRFQTMMMERTPEAYAAFWRPMHADVQRLDERTRSILIFFVGSEMKLGYRHLVRLPRRAIDPAMAGAVFTSAHWRRTTKAPLKLVHDQASNLAKDREMWEMITSPAIDDLTVGIPNRAAIYPLNVAETEFRDSKTSLQLQLCDLVAGASAAWLQRFTGPDYDQGYFDALTAAGIEKLKIGCIWPQPEVSPDKLGTRGMSGKPLDILVEQLDKIVRAGSR